MRGHAQGLRRVFIRSRGESAKNFVTLTSAERESIRHFTGTGVREAVASRVEVLQQL